MGLPSAIACGAEIARRARGRRLAVFLDYDGTLTPIVSRPELALLSDRMRRILAGLSGRAPVAIVSGRDLDDVRSLVGIEGLIYAGSHGFDIAGPGGLRLELEEGKRCLPDLDAAEAALRSALAPIPGALVERKRYGVAAHYRNVGPSERVRVTGLADETARRHPRLRQAHGKMVVEIRPDIDWDKGRAVEWVMSALGIGGPDTLPIYVGDDLTDEDAFRAVRAQGIGIVVEGAAHATLARYVLRGTREVADFLDLVTGLGGDRRGGVST